MKEKGQVVVLASNCLGSGDDTLGEKLMGAFIFTLTQKERIPETVLLYNSGVKLAMEGTKTSEDLKVLEEAGTKVLACGTCVDYFNLKDKLGAGQISNMGEIVEMMQNAELIIRA